MSEREATIERLREKAKDEAVLPEDPGVEAKLEEEVEEPEAEEEAKKSSTREYVILTAWKEVGRIEAGSAESALRTLGKSEGEFAVVPARNWSPFTVKTETTTVTHISPQQ